MRHANPWSVWTRFTCVSLMALAVWSRTWIGWYCVIPIAAAFCCGPCSTRGCSTCRPQRGAGRPGVSSANGSSPIGPRSRSRCQFVSAVPNVANAFSAIGLAIAVYGLVVLAVWPVVTGIVLVHTSKLWYIDRMVLLFDDVKHRDPEVGVMGVRLLATTRVALRTRDGARGRIGAQGAPSGATKRRHARETSSRSPVISSALGMPARPAA